MQAAFNPSLTASLWNHVSGSCHCTRNLALTPGALLSSTMSSCHSYQRETAVHTRELHMYRERCLPHRFQLCHFLIYFSHLVEVQILPVRLGRPLIQIPSPMGTRLDPWKHYHLPFPRLLRLLQWSRLLCNKWSTLNLKCRSSRSSP